MFLLLLYNLSLSLREKHANHPSDLPGRGFELNTSEIATAEKCKEIGTNSHNSSIIICILYVLLGVQQIKIDEEGADEKTSDLTETTLESNANEMTSSLRHCCM